MVTVLVVVVTSWTPTRQPGYLELPGTQVSSLNLVVRREALNILLLALLALAVVVVVPLVVVAEGLLVAPLLLLPEGFLLSTEHR